MTSHPIDDEFAASAAEELNAHILREGFEQGCVVPLEARRYIVPSDEDVQLLRSQWSKLDGDAVSRIRELERGVVPGLTQCDIATLSEGFVILTQQCDLAREPKQEPTLEVARISTQPTKESAQLRSLRSWRQVVVAEHDGHALVADSRQRLLLDKRCLRAFPALQALPDSGRDRRRFAWWAGARYFRRPVPTELYEAIEKPLREAIRDDVVVHDLADSFLMFLIDAETDRPRLVGIFEDEASRETMEEAMDGIFASVSFKSLSEDDYDAQAIGQVPVALFLGPTAYVLDLEGFSGEDSPLPPSLEP